MTSVESLNNKKSALPTDTLTRITHLSANNIADLEEMLSKSDVCSLTFLLGDKLEDEITLMDMCYNLFTDDIQTPNKFWPFKSHGLLHKWFQSADDSNWREKLIEALLVTQNYGVLKKWQLDINNLKTIFESTSKWQSVHINPLRKVLFLLCDDLCENDWRTLCTAVNIEADLPKDDKQQHGLEFPEISILYWSSKQIINIKSIDESNISVIQKNLLRIKRDDWIRILSDLREDNCFSISKPIGLLPSIEPHSRSKTPVNLDDRYPVNKDDAGVCVIFNQELVEGYDEPREGTRKDAEYLEKTFKCFGFQVVIRNNVNAATLIREMCFFSQKNMGCYVVAILSHGERNVIKGSDGEDVNIDEIQDTLLCIKSLKDKPKLLLIQACQANSNYSNGIATDGGRRGHLFVYMAALPGDVAYRHKVLGSYFINHLCDTLLENSDHANWSEIIRLCNAKMEKEEFAYLMPWHRCAFTKHLILIAKSGASAKKILKEEQEKRKHYLANKRS